MYQDKIKVIHSAPVWLPQTQTWMYNQIKYMPSEAVECHIVCERTANLGQFYVPNIHSFSEAPRWEYYLVKALQKLGIRHRQIGLLTKVAKETGANILHSHFGNYAWINIGAAKKASIRHVVTFYGYDVNKLPHQDPMWLNRYQELFNHGDLFLCEGPFMASCLEKLGCPEEKIQVQHIGVDIENILYKPRNWKLNKPLRVLIAASFREKKGIPDALMALSRIQNNVDLSITIIGDATNEPRCLREKDRIMEVIRKYNLESKVRMLGFKNHSELFSEAYKHHVFISPSITSSDGDTEGGAPITLIEMIATGMPVVSTNHCDIPNVVNYGDRNWLVEEKDVSGLANRLMELVNNPDSWINMLDQGRKHIEDNFNVETQSDRLARIYKTIYHQ